MFPRKGATHDRLFYQETMMPSHLYSRFGKCKKTSRQFKLHSAFMHLGGSSPVIGLYSCLRVNAVFFSQYRWTQAAMTDLSILVGIKES